jgi:menaquinone-dependent protoporphyrinogen oxidase
MSAQPFDPLGPAQDATKPGFPSVGVPLQRVAVFFATREGHTKQIAERVAADLRKLGFDVDLFNARRPMPFSFSDYSGVVLAASVHRGSHEKEMAQFVKDHRPELERLTTAFLSITLSEAGAERQDASPAVHEKFVDDVDRTLGKFFEDTNWMPTLVEPVAGALLYSRYNFLVRLVMRRIAKKVGAGTDTSHDYVYTDWVELDKFAGELAAEIRGPQVSRVLSAGQS